MDVLIESPLPPDVCRSRIDGSFDGHLGSVPRGWGRERLLGRIEGDWIRVALTGGWNRPMTPILVGRVVATSFGSAVVGDVRGGHDSLRVLNRLMIGFLVFVWLPLSIVTAVGDIATQPAVVLLPLWGLALLPLWKRWFRDFGEQHDVLAAEMLRRLARTVEGRLADANVSLAAAERP
jgi:hypothetical protein